MKCCTVVFVIISLGLLNSVVTSQRATIGVILQPGELRTFDIIQSFLWRQDNFLFHNADILKEIVKDGDAVELNRAVCRLLERGIVALFATMTPFTYKVLLPYSNEFHIPLIAPSFPAVNLDSVASYGVGIQPSMTRAILDIFRSREWKDMVYLYDSDHGPERLHEIFLLGYRVMQSQLTGILRVNQSEEANLYLRKLYSIKRNRQFYVILDTRVDLARDIIIRHESDAHIGKSNFHFIIAEPVLDEFWTSQKAVFGNVYVTGFRIRPPTGPSPNFYLSTLKQVIQKQSGEVDIPISVLFMHDAFVSLSEAVKKMPRTDILFSRILKMSTYSPLWDDQGRDCMEIVPKPLIHGPTLFNYLKEIKVSNGLTGEIRFDSNGRRTQFSVDIVETFSSGHLIIGSWSDSSGLRISSDSQINFPTPSARIDKRKRYKISSVLNSPFLMMDNEKNGSSLKGNDRFKGFLKDLIDILARDMNFEYDLQIREDGIYGNYDRSSHRWTGLIGDVVLGKADIALADLTVTSQRHRVIDFTEPFQIVSLSLLMKNPAYVSSAVSSFFFFTSFSYRVWICIFASAVIIAALLFIINKFTGSPDSIESATGLWGRKFTFLSSCWFIMGSMLFQGTGVYPRSISSRILSATWWCFSFLMLALFIANVMSQLYVARIDNKRNPHLAQLKSLSLESIIAESVAREWPAIGLIKDSSTENFIRKSSLPIYKAYSDFLNSHPEVKVSTTMEGFQKVHQSNGHYGFLTASSKNEYESNQEPCDTVVIQDNVKYSAYSMAVPQGSPLRLELNFALTKIRERGELGHLHQQWWIEGSPCLREDMMKKKQFAVNLGSTSGIFYLFLAGLVVAAAVTCIQYFWRMHKREERRKKLSFEDITLGPSSLPLPPPELLEDSPPLEEDSRIIDGWAERRLVPTSFGDRSI